MSDIERQRASVGDMCFSETCSVMQCVSQRLALRVQYISSVHGDARVCDGVASISTYKYEKRLITSW